MKSIKYYVQIGLLVCSLGVNLGCNSFSLYKVKGKGRVEFGVRTDTSIFLETGSEGDEATADLRTGISLDKTNAD